MHVCGIDANQAIGGRNQTISINEACALYIWGNPTQMIFIYFEYFYVLKKRLILRLQIINEPFRIIGFHEEY